MDGGIEVRNVSIHGWRQSKELGEAAALNMVIAKPIAKDVRVDRLAAVIFCLDILLVGFLRSQQVGARAEGIRSTGQAEGVRPDGEADGWGRIEYAGLGCVGNSVAELGIAEAHRVGERPGIEIQPDNMDRRIVHVGKRLKAVRDEASYIPVLLIREAIEYVRVLGDPPIKFPESRGIAER